MGTTLSPARIIGTIGQVNGMVLRPFRQRVDIWNVVLLLIILLAIAGQWHLVLQRIDMPIEGGGGP
jgi:hypothetical protein